MAVTCIYCGRPGGIPLAMVDELLEEDGETVHPAGAVPRMDCCIRCLGRHNRGDLPFGIDHTCLEWGRAGDHCTRGHPYTPWAQTPSDQHPY